MNRIYRLLSIVLASGIALCAADAAVIAGSVVLQAIESNAKHGDGLGLAFTFTVYAIACLWVFARMIVEVSRA